MAENPHAVLSSPELFRLCAAHPDRDEYWPEFVRRFNPLLARGISTAWRKNGQGDWPPDDVAADLLQDAYTAIVKNDFRLLNNFRGATDAEAEAYLAHTAINQTITYLRNRKALRRAADEVSLQELIEEHEDATLADIAPQRAPRLTERELIETLKHCFDGPNAKRDILLFLLHARDGYSAAEIARMEICELKETSIANLLGQMKQRLRKYFSGKV
jgi:RNA polymerase sigma factor (sigma-70 family)